MESLGPLMCGPTLFSAVYSGFMECSNFAYSVRFFRESVAGGGVKQSPRTLPTKASWCQELQVVAKSVEIASLYHPPRYSGKT